MKESLSTAIERVRRNGARWRDLFPSRGDGSHYRLIANENWLAGFWTGMLWLAYAATSDPAMRRKAESLLPSFARRLNDRVNLTHDLGFLFSLSAAAQWRLTGDERARDLALQAADELLARYRPQYGAIQAWDGDENAGRIIIDSMMNLPLLFWASEQTGDRRYRDAAASHAETSLRYLLRADGSTYHTYFFEPASGRPIGPKTHQGWSTDSLWARGQAWAIYGFALAGEWLGESRFLDAAERAANRFLAEMPGEGVPLWDLRLPAGQPRWRDSSAGAIAASALLRLSDLRGSALHRAAARKLMDALEATCVVADREAEGLLDHGALHVPKGWATDEYLIFGDCFWLEALLASEGRGVDLWGPGTG